MSRIVSRRHHKRKKSRMKLTLILLIVCVAFFALCYAIRAGISYMNRGEEEVSGETYESADAADDIEVRLLTPNRYSRPGIPLSKVDGIVVHYTANPGSTAIENRNYFEGLKDGHGTSASSHFVIGLDGEIIQCIPTKEEAYASNDRNSDTLSIECCHYASDGRFTEETYSSLVRLCAYLCHRFSLTEKDIIRHYDVTGKDCPKYFVEHPQAWKQFRSDVAQALSAGDWNLTIDPES